MKFDMGRAWEDATTMIKANKDVLSVAAGAFFFLPSLALSVLAPTTELEAAMAASAKPEQLQSILASYFSSNWPLMALYIVVTMVGSLALYALLGREQRPTVGEAIKIGAVAFLPFLASALIVVVVAGVLFALTGVVAAVTGSMAVAGLLYVVLLLLFFFVSLRLLLVGPVMAIDGMSNPIAAMRRSWGMIKGNTRYVFAFLLLVIIALLVVSMILGIVIGIISALASGSVALWLEAILGGLLGAVFSTIMLALYAAIHRQLSGDSPALKSTFE